ncbi:hypothetical protein GCK32_014493 [Trichostrongylus colubriformis]|uniref:Uncharacterized protein n=1 Tax=Trichostrongylus colubriformis TaxID=6319 RepID=A0AAN8FFM3_TRICO
MSDLSKYLVLAIVISSAVTHAAIFCHMGFCSSARLSKRELWITIQVSLIVLYFLFAFIYWNYLMSLFGASTLTDFLSCIVWVVMNGIHSVIYLVFNQRLQHTLIHAMTHIKILQDVSSVGQAVLMAVKTTRW